MTLQDKITQMIFDRFGRTDRDLAYRIEKEARADERERCVQAIEYAHDDDYTDWKEIAIKAIKAE